VELDFLVESGLGFGFLLGLVQMVAWVMKPKPWTLPVECFIVRNNIICFCILAETISLTNGIHHDLLYCIRLQVLSLVMQRIGELFGSILSVVV
jgi:hypothetical protein